MDDRDAYERAQDEAVRAERDDLAKRLADTERRLGLMERRHADAQARLAMYEDQQGGYESLKRQLQYTRDELAKRHKDLAEAAGELKVVVPEPGTPVAQLLSANVLLRRRASELENGLRVLEQKHADLGRSRDDEVFRLREELCVLKNEKALAAHRAKPAPPPVVHLVFGCAVTGEQHLLAAYASPEGAGAHVARATQAPVDEMSPAELVGYASLATRQVTVKP